jgi:hypothetical protein
MKRPLRPALLALLALAPSACQPGGFSSVVADESFGDQEEGSSSPPPADEPARLVAFDEAAALVLVDPETGEILARRELGGGEPTDVAVDEAAERVIVVLEADEERTRVVEVPRTAAGLGAPSERAPP